MTEADWWTTSYPDKLLDWLFYKVPASERKFRLFALACCRQVSDLLTDDVLPQVLALMEAMADGPVEASKVERLRRQGRDRMPSLSFAATSRVKWHARNAVLCGTGSMWEGRRTVPVYWERNYANSSGHWLYGPFPHIVSEAVFCAHSKGEQAEALAMQLRFLRDLFGPLPFRDFAADPSWLTSDVLALARGIYDERAFDRMPILADALQDAGCDNDDILTHCRDERTAHVRGCWVVDLLLGRPWRAARPHPKG